MPKLDDRDHLQYAYNGLCGVIGNLEQVSEENRPWAIVTHAKTVLEALAPLAYPELNDGQADA